MQGPSINALQLSSPDCSNKRHAVRKCAVVHKRAAVQGLLIVRPVTLTHALQCCDRHLNGFADRPPVRPNMSLGDTLAGLHAAFGIVMALLHRQRNNNGVPGQVNNFELLCGMHRCCGLEYLVVVASPPALQQNPTKAPDHGVCAVLSNSAVLCHAVLC